jgi:hypothetical protein
MPLVQFVAWWVAAISVYGLARNGGNRRFESIICGFLFMLLTECVMEAPTCQNDLINECIFQETGKLQSGGRVALCLLQFREVSHCCQMHSGNGRWNHKHVLDSPRSRHDD